MIAIADIRTFFRGEIRVHESLDRHTWMKVGGPADFYMEPVDQEDLVALVRYLRANGVPMTILGRGSNILVSDDGVRGAIINIETGLGDIRKDGDLVVAEAGARLTKFVDFCVTHGLAGVEMLAGVPGTVGGAVVMNAGAHGGETADHLVDVEILRGDDLLRVPKSEAGFSYRRSGFQRDLVLSARFRLPSGDKEELASKRRELILRRNETQPLDLPNLGSMFKNPPGTFAAKLIEGAGLKGLRIGNAQVSEKHANFMVNLGGATAREFIDLIRRVRATVNEQSGTQLELEVKLIGFPDDVKASVA